ncbi:MAG: hypothetical protein AAB683_02230 [Patescibacteria group bacterium]
MTEQIPKYFAELSKDFKEFKKELKEQSEKIDKVIENQEIHFETIGEMKIQITNIESQLTLKANQVYVDGIDNRVEKLEKVIFV